MTGIAPLAGWQNFYVIVGSSAGALIGLQFVVVTLMANRPIAPGQSQSADAFGTPTTVHLGTALLLAAVATVPWPSIGSVDAIWGVLGVIGVVYELIVIRRMRIQTLYKPVLEDWMFHAVLPLAAYAMLAASAYELRSHLQETLFGPAAAALLLLFIAIHNAWDTVTYHVYHAPARRKSESEQDCGS